MYERINIDIFDVICCISSLNLLLEITLWEYGWFGLVKLKTLSARGRPSWHSYIQNGVFVNRMFQELSALLSVMDYERESINVLLDNFND